MAAIAALKSNLKEEHSFVFRWIRLKPLPLKADIDVAISGGGSASSLKGILDWRRRTDG
jgi:hypothetical protein